MNVEMASFDLSNNLSNVILNIEDAIWNDPLPEFNISSPNDELEYINDDNELALGSEPSDTDSQISYARKVKYNKLSFNDVLTKINDQYEQDSVHRYSSAMDILASYLKGQKIVYMESRTYTVYSLNILMFPSIFLTGFAAIGQEQLSLFTDKSKIILACINAFIAFLLSIINYLKLDATSEAHKISSHQYDKLQSYVEFQSGQILLFSDPLLSKLSVQKQLDEFMNVYKNNDHNGPSSISSLCGNLISDISLNNLLFNKKKELFDKKQNEKDRLINDLKIKISKI